MNPPDCNCHTKCAIHVCVSVCCERDGLQLPHEIRDCILFICFKVFVYKNRIPQCFYRDCNNPYCSFNLSVLLWSGLLYKCVLIQHIYRRTSSITIDTQYSCFICGSLLATNANDCMSVLYTMYLSRHSFNFFSDSENIGIDVHCSHDIDP
eukprot:298916_1